MSGYVVSFWPLFQWNANRPFSPHASHLCSFNAFLLKTRERKFKGSEHLCRPGTTRGIFTSLLCRQPYEPAIISLILQKRKQVLGPEVLFPGHSAFQEQSWGANTGVSDSNPTLSPLTTPPLSYGDTKKHPDQQRKWVNPERLMLGFCSRTVLKYRELYSISCDKPEWKTIWKGIYI